MSTSSQHYSQWKSLHHQWHTVVNDKQTVVMTTLQRIATFSKATGLFKNKTSSSLHIWSSKLVKLPRPHEISFEPISSVITEHMEKDSDHNIKITSCQQGIPFGKIKWSRDGLIFRMGISIYQERQSLHWIRAQIILRRCTMRHPCWSNSSREMLGKMILFWRLPLTVPCAAVMASNSQIAILAPWTLLYQGNC